MFLITVSISDIILYTILIIVMIIIIEIGILKSIEKIRDDIWRKKLKEMESGLVTECEDYVEEDYKEYKTEG